MPSPRARPLTRQVLPAPRSPERPMTQLGGAVWPQAWPIASVSCGLSEVHVTMSGQWAHTVLVAQGNAFAGHDFTDATHAHVGEVLFPSIDQPDCVATGDGKQELEVFAVGQGGEE